MESLSLNCSSCWLPIAKKHSLQLFGQCLFNTSTHSLDTLTDKQLAHVCGKSSIDCSVDSCEPGSLVPRQKSEKQPLLMKEARATRTQTMELILGLIFGMIALAILVVLVVLWLRWKKGRTLICCHFYQTTTSIAEATRRRREHRKQIIDSNPAVIESVVTHGGDMNVPPHSHHNDAYFNDETSNNRRKLYNPMFADSPTGDNRHAQQVATGSNDQTSSNNQFFSSEHLWWTKASKGVNGQTGVEHVISSVWTRERGWTMIGARFVLRVVCRTCACILNSVEIRGVIERSVFNKGIILFERIININRSLFILCNAHCVNERIQCGNLIEGTCTHRRCVNVLFYSDESRPSNRYLYLQTSIVTLVRCCCFPLIEWAHHISIRQTAVAFEFEWMTMKHSTR